MHKSTKKNPFFRTLLTVFLEQNNWEFTTLSTGIFQQGWLSGLGKPDFTFLDQADFRAASPIKRSTVSRFVSYCYSFCQCQFHVTPSHSPEIASCCILNWMFKLGFSSGLGAPDWRFTMPFRFGSFWGVILPTSHVNTLSGKRIVAVTF